MTQKQHVDMYRKLAIRKSLLEKVTITGACYIPFIGDGDIAVELYKDHNIYGADIEPERVKMARSRLPSAEIVQADCDEFPFAGRDVAYSVADFDSYSFPYEAFRTFWVAAKITSPFVCFFTDGQRQAIYRTGHWRDPSGEKRHDAELATRRESAALYYSKIIAPWFEEAVKPWQVVDRIKYLRGPSMLYWGAIIEKDVAAAPIEPQVKTETDRNIKIENALFEAALSGNVPAIELWLSRRMPDKWGRGGAAGIVAPDNMQAVVESMVRELPKKAQKKLEPYIDGITTLDELNEKIKWAMTGR